MRKVILYIMCVVAVSLFSCTPTVENAKKVDRRPSIYPDYLGVTVPAGIAPLNFTVIGKDVDAVDVGKPQVQQHHVRPVRQGVNDCLLAVFGPVILVVLGFKRGGDEVAHGDVVLDKQNLGFIHRSLPPMPAG